MHGEVSCRVRINWSWIFAKWHHRGNIDLLIMGLVGGLFVKDTSLRWDLRGNFFLLCKQNSPLTWTLKSFLSLSLKSLSLSSPPSRSQGRAAAAARHQHAAARWCRAQPRGGGAQPRAGGGSGRRSAWFGGGIPCWLEKRGNFSFGVV